MRKLTKSLVGKASIIMGVMILAVLAMIVVSFKLSANVVNSIQTLQTKDISISQDTADAYSSFLEMDDQANMWVGLYGFHDTSLSTATLQQILQAEQKLNSSLEKLKPLFTSQQEQALFRKTEEDAKGYENYFSQVQKLNATDHQQAQQIMYVDNSNVSNALTADLQRLKAIGKQGVANQAHTSISSSQYQERVIFIGGSFVALLGLSLLVFLYFLLKPLQQIAHEIHNVAEGDLMVEEIKFRRRDEVGVLAESVNNMVRNLSKIFVEVSLNAEHVAASSEELMASAEQTSRATEHIAASIQEVATGSENQFARTQSAVTTIGDIASATEQIAGSAHQVSATAGHVTELAEAGHSSISQVIEKMQSIQDKVNDLTRDVDVLGDRSNRIGQIIGVITDIASQTNLLALNAAIEAARAGEQGRGFAVVAAEVRKLAEQSSDSAKEIVTMVQSIQEDTGRTVRMTEVVRDEVESGMMVAQHAGSAFERIQGGVLEVAQGFHEVSTAVKQVSTNTVVARESMQNVSGIARAAVASTENVSAASEEQLAAMEEITSAATALSEMAEQLQTVITKFTFR